MSSNQLVRQEDTWLRGTGGLWGPPAPCGAGCPTEPSQGLCCPWPSELWGAPGPAAVVLLPGTFTGAARRGIFSASLLTGGNWFLRVFALSVLIALRSLQGRETCALPRSASRRVAAGPPDRALLKPCLLRSIAAPLPGRERPSLVAGTCTNSTGLGRKRSSMLPTVGFWSRFGDASSLSTVPSCTESCCPPCRQHPDLPARSAAPPV